MLIRGKRILEEIEWQDSYRIWMSSINNYKNRGGRVLTGSDSGFVYQVFGRCFDLGLCVVSSCRRRRGSIRSR